ALAQPVRAGVARVRDACPPLLAPDRVRRRRLRRLHLPLAGRGPLQAAGGAGPEPRSAPRAVGSLPGGRDDLRAVVPERSLLSRPHSLALRAVGAGPHVAAGALAAGE